MTLRTFTGILLIFLFAGCAKIGSPTGGPKDMNPPEYLSGDPENRSLNFKDDQIDIFFNEYIQLKDQNREVIVSPPMNKKPAIRVREKSIRVTFNEDLLPNATYTMNFGLAISDLNESNPLPDFEYVFSTGSTIDSLSVTGSVVDAFTNKPDDKASTLVLLYENLADSAPLLEIPRYYGRCNKYGLFAVNNIHADTFRIFAIQDANNNLKYDQGFENIAFSDSLIVVNSSSVTAQTFIKDTVRIIIPARKIKGSRSDTTSVADTVIAPGKQLNAVSVSMYSFSEENNRVFVLARNRESAENFTLVFNRPLYEPLLIKPLNFETDSSWIIPESNVMNDTLSYWLTDTVTAKRDTLMLQLTWLSTDSSGALASITDTVRLRYNASASAKGTGRRNRPEQKKEDVKGLGVRFSIGRGNTLNLNSQVGFIADRPIGTINPFLIEMFKWVDTVLVTQPFETIGDTLSVRKFRLFSNWEEDTQYSILLKPGSIVDIYGHTNDSVELKFKTQQVDYYGRILLNFSSYQYPMIIQLISERGIVVKSAIAVNPGIIEFDYLSPGKYSFKAIYDSNGNQQWDTGNYLKKIQPEKIYLSGKSEQLRSNWDWEPTWSITKQ
jgi:hypothetical protein